MVNVLVLEDARGGTTIALLDQRVGKLDAVRAPHRSGIRAMDKPVLAEVQRSDNFAPPLALESDGMGHTV